MRRRIRQNTLMRTVLVIDDNPAVGDRARGAVLAARHRTLRAATPEEGLALLARERVDLVIQDMNFRADTTSGEEGVALFRAIRARHPDLPVILLTAWTHLETAVELVKAGAADYLAKPWDDRKLLATVETCWNCPKARRELVAPLHGENAARSAQRCSSATTCAASCSPIRDASACWRSPARSRAPTCRC